MIINALGGLENPNLALIRPQGDNPVDSSAPDVDARAIRDTRAAGVTAVNVTLGYVGGADEPFEYTIGTIGVWDAILRRHPAELVKIQTAADIAAARKSGKIGIIYGFQNAAMMGRDASRAGIFADRGVRIIQLTYNPANQIGHGCMSAEDGVLTAFGHQVVESLNANRIMVDLSHSGTRTCLDAARISKAPISINHTGCRALTDLPRNKSDEELRFVASKGGFVGIYFMPFLKLDGHPDAGDVAAHIDHAVNVCGEDHVGIGTDGSATAIDDLGAYGAYLAKQVEDRRRSGLGATGERADSYPFVVDLRGVDQFRKLARLLKAHGHSETRVEKILGLNFLRYARDVWGG
jgi:membrane dipeptidase